ncbi:MAG: N-acetyltransferase [Pseudomonadota bacterium]
MQSDVQIRAFGEADLDELERLYPAAFPQEELRPLVRELSDASEDVVAWVAELKGTVMGHIAFARCAVGNLPNVYLLGPLAVTPQHQRKGVGKALIAFGLADLRERNASHVYVLGDPNYYGRHGFKSERTVSPPFELPAQWDGAWQSIALSGDVAASKGTLLVPPVWEKPELWSD